MDDGEPSVSVLKAVAGVSPAGSKGYCVLKSSNMGIAGLAGASPGYDSHGEPVADDKNDEEEDGESV